MKKMEFLLTIQSEDVKTKKVIEVERSYQSNQFAEAYNQYLDQQKAGHASRLEVVILDVIQATTIMHSGNFRNLPF